MTFLEAVTSIEKRVSKLGIKYRDGELMDPSVAIGRVGRFHKERYEHVIDSLKSGQISVDAYYLEMMKMINEYATREREIR